MKQRSSPTAPALNTLPITMISQPQLTMTEMPKLQNPQQQILAREIHQILERIEVLSSHSASNEELSIMKLDKIHELVMALTPRLEKLIASD